MGTKIYFVFAASLFLHSPLQGVAADLDGSRNVLCSVIETHECSPNADCQKGTAESINVPQFFKVNFKDEIITSIRPGGEMQTSPIQRMERGEGGLFLQGIQSGRAWSAAISGPDGRLVLTASGDQEAFVVLGACTDEYE